MKARKHKARDVPAKDGAFLLTYVGEAEQVSFMGVDLPRGVAVAVDQAVAGRLVRNRHFEVTREPA
jgi:hypothetical protein